MIFNKEQNIALASMIMIDIRGDWSDSYYDRGEDVVNFLKQALTFGPDKEIENDLKEIDDFLGEDDIDGRYYRDCQLYNRHETLDIEYTPKMQQQLYLICLNPESFDNLFA